MFHQKDFTLSQNYIIYYYIVDYTSGQWRFDFDYYVIVVPTLIQTSNIETLLQYPIYICI